MAREWAEQRSVQLDTELNLTDKGISAYLGANAETGALGAFLLAVSVGTVPRGSWLLVESLDRISRENAWRASHTIQSIVSAGVTVVDLSDGGREYSVETLEKDMMLFVMMVLRFSRANEESALKGSRVAAAFLSKRNSFAGKDALDKPYTRRLPAWMRWCDELKQYEIIADRGALVREMFELTAAQTRYTCSPLVTRVTVPSQYWHFSTPAKIDLGSRLELRPRAAVVSKRLFTRSNSSRFTTAGRRCSMVSSGLRFLRLVIGSFTDRCGVNTPMTARLVSILRT
jgi:DNA invertase Pin-like site-specific DNA recombinase